MLNPIELAGKGISLAAGAVKLAVGVPKFALTVLGYRQPEDPFAAARAAGEEARYVPVEEARVRTPGRASAPAPEARAPVTVPPIPKGARRERDVHPNGSPRRRDPDAAEEATLVESEGAAAPHAEIHVDAPWEGYDRMRATDIVDRVKGADQSLRAVVLLYEQTHKKRKSVIAACK